MVCSLIAFITGVIGMFSYYKHQHQTMHPLYPVYKLYCVVLLILSFILGLVFIGLLYWHCQVKDEENEMYEDYELPFKAQYTSNDNNIVEDDKAVREELEFKRFRETMKMSKSGTNAFRQTNIDPSKLSPTRQSEWGVAPQDPNPEQYANMEQTRFQNLEQQRWEEDQRLQQENARRIERDIARSKLEAQDKKQRFQKRRQSTTIKHITDDFQDENTGRAVGTTYN